MAAKTIIEIDSDSACKVIVCNSDGTKNNKHITFKKLLELLNSSTEEVMYNEIESMDYTITDILPGDQ